MFKESGSSDTDEPVDARDFESAETRAWRSIYGGKEAPVFAAAMHEALKLPLVAVVSKIGDKRIEHVAVRAPDGHLLDATGYHTKEELQARFSFNSYNLLQEITLEELRARTALHPMEVLRARDFAQKIYPTLLWDCIDEARARAFLEILQEASTKLGVVLGSELTAHPPTITKSDGTVRYDLRRLPLGNGFHVVHRIT